MFPQDLQSETQFDLPVEAEASWVRDMREYFRQTGEVRTKDVTRLLGDPGTVVYMRGREENQCAGHSIFG